MFFVFVLRSLFSLKSLEFRNLDNRVFRLANAVGGSSLNRWAPGLPPRRGFGRGGRRSNRTRGRNYTVIYRPGESETKNCLNLFDPTLVPKGRNYFEHEDRSKEFSRGFRGRSSRGPRRSRAFDRPSQQSRQKIFEEPWKHDLYEADMSSSSSQHEVAAELVAAVPNG
ncbi:unnamed protein product [Soboliphyme baturini]|uniref:Btz domain-containing protein n=1 Tax=Soboliphyme baturini TaxID=241478 RepID=A0A183ICB8_9BILA|nr:unnamed protein product [Soboliphyme baturini]